MAWTLSHMGRLDLPIPGSKRYMNEPMRRLGLYRMLRGPRFRQAFGSVLPSFRREEWPPPRLLINRRKFDQATRIAKLVTPPGGTSFVLKHRPNVKIFHIARHPGGFLNSWASRYLAARDADQVRHRHGPSIACDRLGNDAGSNPVAPTHADFRNLIPAEFIDREKAIGTSGCR